MRVFILTVTFFVTLTYEGISYKDAVYFLFFTFVGYALAKFSKDPPKSSGSGIDFEKGVLPK